MNLRSIIFSIVCFGPLATANAQPTVACTTDPIYCGGGGAFQLEGGYNGWSPGPCTWQYQWSVGACTPAFKTTTDTGANTNLYFWYPGSLTVKCTITYSIMNGTVQQQKTFSPQITVSVPPPDGIRILSGDNVSAPINTVNPTKFQITSKGKDCVYLNCFCQEKITDLTNPVTKKRISKDEGWIPTQNTSGRFLYLGQGQILDNKRYATTGWACALDPGTTFLTATQTIRITIKDPCGNPMAPIVFKPYLISEKKDTNNGQCGTYVITHK